MKKILLAFKSETNQWISGKISFLTPSNPSLPSLPTFSKQRSDYGENTFHFSVRVAFGNPKSILILIFAKKLTNMASIYNGRE